MLVKPTAASISGILITFLLVVQLAVVSLPVSRPCWMLIYDGLSLYPYLVRSG